VPCPDGPVAQALIYGRRTVTGVSYASVVRSTLPMLRRSESRSWLKSVLVDHLDLSGVAFYGVAGLEALLDAHSLLRSQGASAPMVVRILRVCRITELEGLIVTIAEKPGVGDDEVGAD
jgi:hypothetical protein